METRSGNLTRLRKSIRMHFTFKRFTPLAVVGVWFWVGTFELVGADPASEVDLTGVSSLFGSKKAMLIVRTSGQAEKSVVVSEGESVDGIQVVRIDEKNSQITVRNSGKETTLNLRQIVSVQPQPIAPVVSRQPMPANQVAAPAPAPSAFPTPMAAAPEELQPRNEVTVIGRRTRNADGVGFPTARAQPIPTERMSLSPELQRSLLMRERIRRDSASVPGAIPPIAPTPPAVPYVPALPQEPSLQMIPAEPIRLPITESQLIKVSPPPDIPASQFPRFPIAPAPLPPKNFGTMSGASGATLR